MQLTEVIQIRKGSALYDELDRVCFLSKNLYNASLYAIRQHFFKTGKYLNYPQSNGNFIKEKNRDYYALPTKVSQQTMKMADQNFRSFFGALKSRRKSRIPKYLEKTGRYLATFTVQAISSKELKNGFVKFSGIDGTVRIREGITNVKQIRVVPKITFNRYDIEVIHEVSGRKAKADNGRYASVDLGVSNFATVSFNCARPFIVNGRPLKSINQFYNKKKSQLSKLKSNRSRSLNRKRNCKVNDYLHKSSRLLVNQLVSMDIATLVIGKNDGWKQETGIGRRNNQNFVGIPFEKFLTMLEYKCRLEGINVIVSNESYTSKCSFLDGEEICRHDVYAGKRIKRGLFRSGSGRMINADLNGSLNIMRKAVGENAFADYPIEVCSTPVVVTPSK